MKKERCFNNCLKENKMSFPRNVVGNLNLLENTRRRSPSPRRTGNLGDDNINKQQRRAWKIPDQVRDDRLDFIGFTLIELLVVVLIIGILAAVALPQYQKAVLKARLTQMMVYMDALYKSAEIHYMANGRYPNDVTELDIDISGTAVEFKQDQYITSTPTKAAFFPDGTECMIARSGSDFIGCFNENFVLLRNHGYGYTACYGWNKNIQTSICRGFGGSSVGTYGAYGQGYAIGR